MCPPGFCPVQSEHVPNYFSNNLYTFGPFYSGTAYFYFLCPSAQVNSFQHINGKYLFVFFANYIQKRTHN